MTNFPETNKLLPNDFNKTSNSSKKRRLLLKSSALAIASCMIIHKRTFANSFINSNQISKNTYLDIDQNDLLNDLRATILFGIGEIPEIGGFISLLIGFFWPESSKDVWDEIKEKVEKLVDQKIDEEVYQLVKEDLTGLGNILKAYNNAIKISDDPAFISENFVSCDIQFRAQLPHFSSKGHEESLLPLYSIYAILHLTLLRDGILNSDKMAWKPNTKQLYIDDISNFIKEYCDYIDSTYKAIQAKANAQAETEAQNDFYGVKYFRIKNDCYRKYQLAALDFREIYPYFDPIKYPTKVTVNLTRVLYCGPFGGNDNGFKIEEIPQGRSDHLVPPSSFSLYSGGNKWSDDDGYDGGVTGYTRRTPGFDDDYFGTYNPAGGNIYIDCSIENGGPITEFWARNDTSIYSLRLVHKSGKKEPLAGGCSATRPINAMCSIPGHLLVDMYGTSMSNDNRGMVGCIVPGFQLENMGHSNDPSFLLPKIYLSSIKEPSVDDLIQAVSHIPLKEQQYSLALKNHSTDIYNFISSNISIWQQNRSQFWKSCEQAYVRKNLNNSQ